MAPPDKRNQEITASIPGLSSQHTLDLIQDDWPDQVLAAPAPDDPSHHVMLLGWVSGDTPAKITHLKVKVVALPLSTPLGHHLRFISVTQERLGIINDPNLHGIARYPPTPRP